ncbi:MAG: LON peptidase substrate-binding domain-containing protein, partial [Deltaproteobacteria bacterium]|nr:LON peptidase substrate-binding domain-containing protein [Deltaproteobacteria bacterium]
MFKKKTQTQKAASGHTIPLLPLRDIVVFPHMVAPLFVGRDKSISALEYAMSLDKRVFLAAQKDAQVDKPDRSDIFEVGTIGVILQLLRLPDGTVKALIEGKERGVVTSHLEHADFFLVEVKPLVDEPSTPLEVQASLRSVISTFKTYARLNKKIPHDVVSSLDSMADPAAVADTVAAHLPLKVADKQELLSIQTLSERLERIFGLMRGEIEILQIEQRLKSRVKKQMEKTQREYYLNEQMRAIQKEMGEKDDFKAEVEELEKRLTTK